MNRITIELCKEDRQRLDELIAFAGLLVGEIKSATAPVTFEVEHPVDVPTTHLEAPTEEPIPTQELTPEVKPITLAEFQKAVTMACAKGTEQKKTAKAIINKYAASVSAVPEDKRAEVMAELAKI